MSSARTDLRLVAVARRSDVGRRRAHNEDRDLVAPPVLAVADGLGGQQAGEVAAAAAIAAVAKVVSSPSSGALRAAAEEANRSIRRLAARSPERSGMGTTLTVAALIEGRLVIVHVGDSRAYRFRDGALAQLTDDHSVVADLVRRGELTPREAAQHPQRNVITRAIGADPVIRADVLDLDVLQDDVVMLCSDGLTGFVSDAEIAEILSRDDNLDTRAAELTAAANDAGGLDNITVVLARIGVGAEAVLDIPDEHPRMGDTAQHPIVGATAPVTVIGRTPPRPRRRDDRPSRTSVLERVTERPERRRGRRGPLAVGVAVLAIVGGATAWVGSRSYFLGRDGTGQATVYHGLPLAAGPLNTYRRWEALGVDASSLPDAERRVLDRGIRGQGEATLAAVRFVWRNGVQEIE